MTPAEEAYRDAWLAELWPVVHGADKARGMVPKKRTTQPVCISCGRQFVQPRDAATAFRWCPKCVAEGAA